MLNRVRGQMNIQAGCVYISSITVVTLVWFVLVVLTPMGLQIRELSERLFTAHVCTFVWPVSCVDPVVLL